MTKVTNDKTPKKAPFQHKVGNWYKNENEYYILSNVDGKIALIGVNNGWFWACPKDVVNTGNITEYEFSSITRSEYLGKFVYVPAVHITEQV